MPQWMHHSVTNFDIFNDADVTEVPKSTVVHARYLYMYSTNLGATEEVPVLKHYYRVVGIRGHV